MERKKHQLLLLLTTGFLSCIFSGIKQKIQRSCTSSLNVSITSLYYRPFSLTFALEAQLYIALGLRKIFPARDLISGRKRESKGDMGRNKII